MSIKIKILHTKSNICLLYFSNIFLKKKADFKILLKYLFYICLVVKMI